MLFKPMAVPNRTETQLAYKLKYFPSAFLSAAAKRLIYKTEKLSFPKGILAKYLDPVDPYFLASGKDYKIVWAFNNIPTEQEWNKLSEDQDITIELRKSPAIPEKYVAIFSLTNSWRN